MNVVGGLSDEEEDTGSIEVLVYLHNVTRTSSYYKG